jgi:hypothetical protein
LPNERFEIAGCRRLRWEKLKVIAVLEMRPPNSPNNSSASRFRSVKDPKVTDSKLKELASSEATQR